MFERLKFLYEQGKLNETALDSAVNKNWITEEQKQEIISVQ